MNFAGMYPRGRGFPSYRGRGGRGSERTLAQFGKQRLIAMDASSPKAQSSEEVEYQEFLEYKKKKEAPSFAKIITEE